MTEDPRKVFHSYHYLRHNSRRIEHLAYLELNVRGKRVLELGAGIGDFSHYFIDRDCEITITEGRSDNYSRLAERYPDHVIEQLDLECPENMPSGPFDIVFAYGILYHVSKPGELIASIADRTREMLLLETCVSFDDELDAMTVRENESNCSQAMNGWGSRPGRQWLWEFLKGVFEHVYVPFTQPNHEEFPLRWDVREPNAPTLQRSVFIASHVQLDNPKLSPILLMEQVHHP